MKDYKLNKQEFEQIYALFMAKKFWWTISVTCVFIFLAVHCYLIMYIGLTVIPVFSYRFLNSSYIVFFGIAVPVLSYIFLPLIISASLQSGKYSCKIGICNDKAKLHVGSRGKTSMSSLPYAIFVQGDDSPLSKFLSGAVNRFHYDEAMPGDEILIIRVLWVRYTVVKRLL